MRPRVAHQQLRCLMQPTGPRVIPQALQNTRISSRHVAPGPRPLKRIQRIRGSNHGQLGHLQHHLSNPDAMGIELIIRRWRHTTRQQLPKSPRQLRRPAGCRRTTELARLTSIGLRWYQNRTRATTVIQVLLRRMQRSKPRRSPSNNLWS